MGQLGQAMHLDVDPQNTGSMLLRFVQGDALFQVVIEPQEPFAIFIMCRSKPARPSRISVPDIISSMSSGCAAIARTVFARVPCKTFSLNRAGVYQLWGVGDDGDPFLMPKELSLLYSTVSSLSSRTDRMEL